MYRLFFISVCFALFGCGKSSDKTRLYYPEPDIRQTSYINSDTLLKPQSTPPDTMCYIPDKQPVNQQLITDETIESKAFEKATDAYKNDTTYYRYVNGAISVKITAWQNGRRNIILYDLKGNKTYTQEEVHLSFTINADIIFAKNGSVERMEIHNNPGASNFWYETTISFSTTNQPQWMETRTLPGTTLSGDETRTYFWNSKSHSWVLQETISCNPMQN